MGITLPSCYDFFLVDGNIGLMGCNVGSLESNKFHLKSKDFTYGYSIHNSNWAFRFSTCHKQIIVQCVFNQPKRFIDWNLCFHER